MKPLSRNDAAPLAGGAGVKINGLTQDSTRPDDRYMRAWIARYGGGDRGWDWRASRDRMRREAALNGPLHGTGPFTRITLALLRGDRLAALNIARAVDDELGYVGRVLAGEPETGGDR